MPQLLWTVFLLLCLFAAEGSRAAADDGWVPPPVWVLDIKGAIGPASSDHVVRTLKEAARQNAGALVIRIDTPGGLDAAMRDIIQAILASPVPVISYVGPSGARAASAGTYIVYASHVAAMSPATNLGSATPVQIGLPAMPQQEEEEGVPAATAMEKKIVNDAAAYIAGLAELRGRNVSWAEEAVREGVSLPAADALDKNVIDRVAESLPDLLDAVDGTRVRMADGDRVLWTAGAEVVLVEEDWRTAFLKTITNPNLVLILGMLGFYGLVLEFYGSGGGIAGTIGAIALFLAGYGLQMLPVNLAGLGLMVLGLGLMFAEMMSPSFGIFGTGGIAAFILGGIFLVDTELQAFQAGLPVLAAMAIVSAAFLIFTGYLMLRLRKQRIVMGGADLLVGETGLALADFSSQGQVRVGAEIWKASTEAPVKEGDAVRILHVDGLALRVTPVLDEPRAEAAENA